jgi:pimeloyl-ACP methyl ester carboxylesterase
MAAPGGKFFIQDNLSKPAAHHESFAQLWETKWKAPATMGVYPFMFSTAADFQPVVDKLIEGDFKEPYNWDEYAQVYFPQAEHLKSIAEQAEAAGEKEKASEYYLRASAVYRISRFPAPRSQVQREAWRLGKAACIKGLGMREHPVHEVEVPHTHGASNEGSVIPVYHLVPDTATPEAPVPTVVIFTGLDGYRTELAVWMEGWRQVGVATVVLEIPGTGDCPANPSDPTSPDRLYSSLFDWMDAQPLLDSKKRAIWAFSTGGFYAIRVAHTHADRLAGVVALGGGCHHMFDREWLDNVNHLEYPFDLANTLAYKWGYGDDVEAFKREAKAKFSLLEDRTLDMPECARLLLVNGTEDEIFPIDDYYLALQHGAPKEARFVKGIKHMGEPASFFIIIKWLYKLFGVEADVVKQMQTLPFKPKEFPSSKKEVEVELERNVEGSEKREGEPKEFLSTSKEIEPELQREVQEKAELEHNVEGSEERECKLEEKAELQRDVQRSETQEDKPKEFQSSSKEHELKLERGVEESEKREGEPKELQSTSTELEIEPKRDVEESVEQEHKLQENVEPIGKGSDERKFDLQEVIERISF